MNRTTCARLIVGVLIILSLGAVVGSAQSPPPLTFTWQTVVNNGVAIPGDGRTFNSYNQPSLNMNGVVVFRARSKGGTSSEPAHGVFLRDMKAGTPLITLFDRTTPVPQPNNLGSTFVEPPSFPRIDMWSNTIASRGNHQPAWNYMLPDGLTETRAGTTGIYTNPFGSLIGGENNLAAVPGFEFFGVPQMGALKFDVFPGAPAVTDGATVVFKGNYTVGLVGKTGVYYRDMTDHAIPGPGGSELSPASGTNPAVLIANSDMFIPGTSTPFGSTAPPSAVGRKAVFAGFDNEDAPTLGGLYLAPLTGPTPPLTALVQIGDRVPGEPEGNVFNKLGEGVSYDGRFVAFWGAWGTDTTTLVLQCVSDGNKERVAYCHQQYPNGFTTTVPVHQGIFVHDTVRHETFAVAKTPGDFTDFVYWNFSGLVPGTGQSDETGEPARWRAASFVAVSGNVNGQLSDPMFHAAFKARTGEVTDGAYVNPVDGIYLRMGPVDPPIQPVVTSGTDGTLIDPEAVYDDDENPDTPPVPLPVTTMGLERDSFRGNMLALNVSMGTEAAGWAGIYLVTVPTPHETSTALSSNAELTEPDQAVTFTAAVTEVEGGGTPTGTVQFFHETTPLETRTLGADGIASLTLSTLPPGAHEIRAEYSGDASHGASTATVTHRVGSAAVMLNPAPGTRFSGAVVSFQWSEGAGVEEYTLSLGSSSGASNLYNQSLNRELGATVTIPATATGGYIYARLSSNVAGVWRSRDYLYTAAGNASKAIMTSPAPGSKLSSGTATFGWSAGTGVSAYTLWVGTSGGTYDIYKKDLVPTTSATVTIPASAAGGYVYVRLYSYIAGAWQFNDYRYTAAGAGVASSITSPTANSKLASATPTFQWNTGTGVSAYTLWVGTSVGTYNIYKKDLVPTTSATVTIPASAAGGYIYVRLYSYVGGAWKFNDYRYTSAGTGVPAAIISPAPSTTIRGRSATFTWGAGTGVTAYRIQVTNATGTVQYANRDTGTARSVAITTLPSRNIILRVRLYSFIAGEWKFRDYRYVNAP